MLIKVAGLEVDLKALAAAAERLAVGDVAEGARKIEDVEVLFMICTLPIKP